MNALMPRRWSVVLALAASLTAAACGSSPSPAGSGGKSSFLACEVTDTGGIDDRSFNASAWKGLQNSNHDLGIKVKYLSSTSPNDYAPNIQQFERQKCGIIITVGFLMADATKAAAAANPNQKFAIIDNTYTPTIPNVVGIFYRTDQAGFLGGYLAAGMSKTGKVGTFGGVNIPPVTIYMNGYAAGVDYYNQKHGTHVKVLGWDPSKPTQGSFSGDFTSQDKGRSITETLIQQGADVIFPVAGNVGLGAAAAVQSMSNVMMEWVDTDGCVSAPQYCGLFITSVTKGIAASVENVVKQAVNGTFQGGNYTGTLQNNGVGISPYHDWASKIPASLQSEITTVKQGIINGSISVDPKSYPQG
ncbi:MAG: BMP family lipoprotein [Candidatus Dormibacterales bacterium]